MNTRWRPWLALLLGFSAGNLTMWGYLRSEPPLSTQRLLAEAREALANGDGLLAEQLALRALQNSSGSGSSTAALLVAGEAATKLKRFDDAVAYYERIPDTGGETSIRALTAEADLLFQMARFSESETAFRRAFEIEPHDEFANRSVTEWWTCWALWAGGGRCGPTFSIWSSLDKFTAEDLVQLADFDSRLSTTPRRSTRRWLPFPTTLARCWFVPKSRTRTMTGRRRRRFCGKWSACGPGTSTPRPSWGKWSSIPRMRASFTNGGSSCPPMPNGIPTCGSCAASGRKRINRSKPPHAAMGRRSGSSRTSVEPISTWLWCSMRWDTRRRASRSDGGPNYYWNSTTGCDDVYVVRQYAPDREHHAGRMAQLTEALGRIWEAWAWNTLLAQQGDTAAAVARDRLKKILDKQLPPQTVENFNPALAIDLSGYALPDWSHRREAASPNDTRRVDLALAKVDARFVDSTQEAGIDFSYVNGDDPQTKIMKLHQPMGGGVAVLDYDGDGWPDLHFTQGAKEPFDDADTSHVDRLYRNLGNGRFADVTLAAGVPDHRYSQGATVGDYDNDGFPDLFVSNIGKSRLYRNNGDGTFADVTVSAGITLDHWSTSGIVADLNGDGLPDIFDVTYLHGRSVLNQLCGAEFGNSCTPAGLPGDVDRRLLNIGDGTFRDVTEVAGLALLKGNGLGLVAADIDRSGRLSLFVANDTDANFYLANQTTQRGAAPWFEERGVLHGLAYDRDGKPQANMGIAADDCNGDGLLDLYVTTFYQDSKTLRVQQPEQMFVDVTREANLRDSGFNVLGFGTQFLDGELDGLPDLVVTNGHVYDWSSTGIPFEMPPQYFRNVGAGRFVEKSAASLGPFFEGKYLGRGLARLDWNRDGREDFAVSHIHSPAALVTNQTVGAGHFLAVRLVAVNSARDAIGAIATLTAGDFTRVRELTAGDGYYASNQRELVFGLGDRNKIDKLVIRWPSGGEQEFADLQVDREYLLIESRETPVALHVDRQEAVVQPNHRLN